MSKFHKDITVNLHLDHLDWLIERKRDSGCSFSETIRRVVSEEMRKDRTIRRKEEQEPCNQS